MTSAARTLVLLVAVAACGPRPEPPSAAARAPLTRRQRDSAIGRSALPGAHAVIAAIGAADRLSAGAAAADSVGASAP